MGNQKIIVTGASRGIGKAIATCFAQKGYDVAICARDNEKLQALAIALRKNNVEVLAFTCDVSNKNEVADFIKKITSQWDSINILVNNAGIYLPGRVVDEEDGALERLIETNLYSAYHFSRAVAPIFQKQKSGYIFNIASVAGLKAYPNGGSYSISKFAMIGLSKALREELKEDNVRVTTISPGPVYTDSWYSAGIPEERFIPASDLGKIVFDLYNLSPNTLVEDLVVRPILGDI
jgi:short-subunit dehydrogenase